MSTTEDNPNLIQPPIADEQWARLDELSGGLDPLDTPYGPTEFCFSSTSLALMFQFGAKSADISHLESCDACRARVHRYALALQQAQQLSQTHQHASQAKKPQDADSFWNRLFGKRNTSTPRQTPALLFVAPGSFPVDVKTGRILAPILVQVITPELKGHDFTHLQLNGVVSSGQPEEVLSSEKGFPCLRFNNVVAQGDLLRTLASHSPAQSEVTLVGNVPGLPQPIAGSVKMDFVRKP